MDIEKLKNINKQIEEQIGTTFCMAKFHHATIHLQTGETQSCHHPFPHKIPLEEIENNPSALHNTKQKKLYRKQMLESKRPDECDYCWNIEDTSKGNISDRHINNYYIYSKQEIEYLKEQGGNIDFNPTRVEVSFGNQCQFKCGYCSPKASSSYWQETEKYGPMHEAHDLSSIQLWKSEDDNPYIKAWWKWWPHIKDGLIRLRITGGEALLQESTWRVFKEINNGIFPYLELCVNSNLGVNQVLVRKLTTYVSKFEEHKNIKKFELYTSLDTWGERAEYLRTGLNLVHWENNLHFFLQNTKASISVMVTFNALAVTTFKDFLKKILEWRKIYPDNMDEDTRYHRVRFQIHYLRYPEHYSIHVLSKKEFIPYMYDALGFIGENISEGDGTKFSQSEYELFKRVVDYMEKPIWNKDQMMENRSKFYTWFQKLDERRETDFLSTFPEYTDFMEKCRKTNLAKNYLISSIHE